MLETTQKGQTANTPGNYKAVFLYDPLLSGAFSNNLLTDRIDIVKPLGWQVNKGNLLARLYLCFQFVNGGGVVDDNLP